MERKRDHERYQAFQDGGQFYDDFNGDLIVDYGRVKDYDVDTARNLRKRFQQEYPYYYMEKLDEEE